MPGWIFVSGLLAVSAVLALLLGRELVAIVAIALAAIALVSGALTRPERGRPDPLDRLFGGGRGR